MKQYLVLALILFPTILFSAELPANLKWETNEKDALFASPDAKKGGNANLSIATFPLTLRTVGPDANSSELYRPLVSMSMGLTSLHPNTQNPVPLIATHWSIGKDNRTVYYKLNPEAKWSDGKPLVAADFKFTLEFMLSKNIVAPWYNNHYSQTFEEVIVFDDHTLAIKLKKARPRILLFADLPPTPRHFYGGVIDADFVRKYNWAIVPTPGPYQITQVDKGKQITMKRVVGWWGENLKYMQHRFNVDTINFHVVRETNVSYEWFKAGKLDFFNLLEPNYWYDRSSDDVFKRGLVERLMFYNDTYRPSYGFWLNRNVPVLSDLNVRLGIQHSLNFDKLISSVFRNESKRLNTTCDGFGKYTNDAIKARGFDLQKASGYFDLAGYKTRGSDGIRVKDGQRLSFTVTYAYDEWTPRLALLREEARKAGLDLQLRKLDWAAVQKLLDAKKHDAVLLGFNGDLFPEYWQMFHSTAEDNFTQTSAPELDKLILEYNDEAVEAKKIKLSHLISQKIDDDAAFVPTVTRDWIRIGYWRWWRFPNPPAGRLSTSLTDLFEMTDGGLLWIDQDRYAETQQAMKSKSSFAEVTTVNEIYRKK